MTSIPTAVLSVQVNQTTSPQSMRNPTQTTSWLISRTYLMNSVRGAGAVNLSWARTMTTPSICSVIFLPLIPPHRVPISRSTPKFCNCRNRQNLKPVQKKLPKKSAISRQLKQKKHNRRRATMKPGNAKLARALTQTLTLTRAQLVKTKQTRTRAKRRLVLRVAARAALRFQVGMRSSSGHAPTDYLRLRAAYTCLALYLPSLITAAAYNCRGLSRRNSLKRCELEAVSLFRREWLIRAVRSVS